MTAAVQQKPYVESVYLRWMITIAVMLAAVVEVLDMTIVNVSLPHMMGALGANSQQITWVLTSYIVSSAVCMPLTGFFVRRFGRKRLLLTSISLFLVSSVLCGMSDTLTEIVVFRTFQGIFGAALVPLSQFILRDTFPLEEQGKAMAVWGMGIMAGPILGPTLGGYITEALNWRWVFYINVPVCFIAFFMTLRFIEDTPRVKERIDFLGIALMATGIGSLQIFLDQGNDNNWFDSNFILSLCLIAIIALSAFIIRGILIKERNIINLHLFKDRNFATSCFMITAFSTGLFSILAIIPIMLENLMNYPTSTAGLAMAPQGILSGVGMAIVGSFIMKWDARFFILIGILLAAFGSYMMSQFTLDVSEADVMIACAVQGFGMGLFFVPLATLAFASLQEQDIAEASGIFSFGRSLGSSVGISLISTVLSRETQINWNRLGGHISTSNPVFQSWLQSQHLSPTDPMAAQLLANTLQQQASMVAFVDCYWLVAVSFIVMLPLLLLLKKPDKISLGGGAMH